MLSLIFKKTVTRTTNLLQTSHKLPKTSNLKIDMNSVLKSLPEH